MLPSITVTQQSKQKLIEREYTFMQLDGFEFVLSRFVLRKRQTTRHSFKLVEIYNRIRLNTTYIGVVEHLQPVHVPDSVVRQFQRELERKITLKGYPLWRQ